MMFRGLAVGVASCLIPYCLLVCQVSQSAAAICFLASVERRGRGFSAGGRKSLFLSVPAVSIRGISSACMCVGWVVESYLVGRSITHFEALEYVPIACPWTQLLAAVCALVNDLYASIDLNILCGRICSYIFCVIWLRSCVWRSSGMQRRLVVAVCLEICGCLHSLQCSFLVSARMMRRCAKLSVESVK